MSNLCSSVNNSGGTVLSGLAHCVKFPTWIKGGVIHGKVNWLCDLTLGGEEMTGGEMGQFSVAMGVKPKDEKGIVEFLDNFCTPPNCSQR